jgi:3-O-methylgallate 3,4-dioxygenase
MARIVAGLGTSHSPMLSTTPDLWHLHADRDKDYRLLGTDGRYHSLDELISSADPEIARELTAEKWQARYDACQKDIARVGELFAEISPDVAVIFGDDQEELFHDDNMPAFSVYWGERLLNIAPPMEKKSEGLRVSAWGYYEDRPTEYPGEAQLGRHIIEYLVAQGFDVAHSRVLPEGMGMAHAFTFIHRRIMNGNFVPVVPVFINTYYPPNQPTMGRCYALGKAVRQAIEAWESDKRVLVMASGGLSHFVIDEELDQTVLSALKNKDEKALANLPHERLHSGNSEARNWAALAGAMEPLDMELIDYVPCYRSLGGTGCAMAFAQWR